jgi:hypoxanthine phosphoribosyltransferase
MTLQTEQPPKLQRGEDEYAPWILQPEIDARVTEISTYLGALYAGKHIRLITILNGGRPFADLLHAKMTDLEIGPNRIDMDSILVKSYVGKESRELDWKSDAQSTNPSVHDILVEDIADSGRTLRLVEEELRARGPASLMTVVLLNRPEARQVEYEPAVTGFTIHRPDAWAIGFGMDLDEGDRGLPHIYGKIIDGQMPPLFEIPEFPQNPDWLNSRV